MMKNSLKLIWMVYYGRVPGAGPPVAEGDGGEAVGGRGDGAGQLAGRTAGGLLGGGVSGCHGLDDDRFEGVVRSQPNVGCRGSWSHQNDFYSSE